MYEMTNGVFDNPSVTLRVTAPFAQGSLRGSASPHPRGEAQRSGFDAKRKNGEMEASFSASAGNRAECARSDVMEQACWLCGRNGSGDPLDKHHIFGGANRALSERFGLTVPLCHSRCHIFGREAAHRNAETAQKLHEYGQRKAMQEQGWTRDEFRMIFGKNYLDDELVDATFVASEWARSAPFSPNGKNSISASPQEEGFRGFGVTELVMPF